MTIDFPSRRASICVLLAGSTYPEMDTELPYLMLLFDDMSGTQPYESSFPQESLQPRATSLTLRRWVSRPTTLRRKLGPFSALRATATRELLQISSSSVDTGGQPHMLVLSLGLRLKILYINSAEDGRLYGTSVRLTPVSFSTHRDMATSPGSCLSIIAHEIAGSEG